jgi:hypothetical protein
VSQAAAVMLRTSSREEIARMVRQVAMNQKLNALIDEEVGEDKALFTPPKKD